MANEEILQEIRTGNLQILWNLLVLHREDSRQLREAYDATKHGINIKYHIRYNLDKRYNERPRTQEIELNGDIYHEHDWWNEEEEREHIARKALTEHYEQEEAPYDPR